jgi:hypothetical protein
VSPATDRHEPRRTGATETKSETTLEEAGDHLLRVVGDLHRQPADRSRAGPEVLGTFRLRSALPDLDGLDVIGLGTRPAYCSPVVPLTWVMARLALGLRPRRCVARLRAPPVPAGLVRTPICPFELSEQPANRMPTLDRLTE